jgi:hypothetical protein
MTTVTVTTTGAGSFTIPAGVSSITFEAWGSGNAGGSGAAANAAGGGGGGYISTTYVVSSGDIIYYSVAAPQTVSSGSSNDSWFNKNNNDQFNANGAYIARGGGPIVTGKLHT